MVIDFVIDVVCPWCFIGKRTLDQALEALDLKDTAVRYHPFQLGPTTPTEGVLVRDHHAKKFGDSPQFQEARNAMQARGEKLGITFAYEKNGRIANTLDAHRVIYWAKSAGQGTQTKVADFLMQAYFEEAAFLGDQTVLLEAATKAGMDGGIVQDLLASDRDKAVVQQKADHWRSIGIAGVPFTIIDAKMGLPGAADFDEMKQFLSKALHQCA